MCLGLMLSVSMMACGVDYEPSDVVDAGQQDGQSADEDLREPDVTPSNPKGEDAALADVNMASDSEEQGVDIDEDPLTPDVPDVDEDEPDLQQEDVPEERDLPQDDPDVADAGDDDVSELDAEEDVEPADAGMPEEDVAEEDVAEEDVAEEDVAEEDVAEDDVAEEDVVEADMGEGEPCEQGESLVEPWGCVPLINGCPMHPGTICDEVSFTDVDLSGLDLRGASFYYASFDRVNFDDAILRNANFEGAEMADSSFERANLTRADFTYADFQNINMRDAILNSGRFGFLTLQGDFTGASLRNAEMSFVNVSADLTGVDLSGAELCEVDFSDSTLVNATLDDVMAANGNFETDMTGATMRGALFESVAFRPNFVDGCNFADVGAGDVSFQGVDLREVDMEGATFYGDKLDNAQMAGMDLRTVVFRAKGPGLSPDLFEGDAASLNGADLTGALFDDNEVGSVTFEGANLAGASFRGVSFTPNYYTDISFTQYSLPLSFKDSSLVGADFTGAHLRGVDFSGADLTDAIFSEATLALGIPERFRTDFCSDQLETTFSGAVLTGTQFSSALMTGVDFQGVDITGVDFSSATIAAEELTGFFLYYERRNFRLVPVEGPVASNFAETVMNDVNFECAQVEEGTLFSQASWRNVTCPDATNTDDIPDNDCLEHLVPNDHCNP